MPASRLAGIVEAAHVRAVEDGGPDTLDNGMVLTPTLHRMYDAGLFTLEARDDGLVVRTSPRLVSGMVRDDVRGTVLPLRDGAPFALPADRAAWPSRQAIEHHRRHRFAARP
jgi:putative restriction endonuclease